MFALNTSKPKSNLTPLSPCTDSGVALIVLIGAVCVLAIITLTTIGIFLGKKDKASKESSEGSSHQPSSSEPEPNANE